MPFALITGASSGIGYALARELASRKHNVLLVARTEEKLKEVAHELTSVFGVQADYFVQDLSAINAVDNITVWLKEHDYTIDILINNAGYAVWDTVEEVSLTELRHMLEVNIMTVTGLSKALLPVLLKQPKAYVLNVSSTSAYQAVYSLAAYAASKSYVLLFTRALRRELRGSSVSVSCLSPGTTTTGFMDRAGMEALKATAEKVTMAPEVVARKAIDGLFAGKAEIIPGLINWISAKAAEILPKSLIEKIAENIYRVKK